MELTKEFIDRLRHNLIGDMPVGGVIPDCTPSVVLQCFDRAVATTLVEFMNGAAPVAEAASRGPRAGSKAASERARKAAFTRKVNKAANNNPALTGSSNLAQEG